MDHHSVVTVVALPMPNANGWNNSNVTVTFNGTDAVSGLDHQKRQPNDRPNCQRLRKGSNARFTNQSAALPGTIAAGTK